MPCRTSFSPSLVRKSMISRYVLTIAKIRILAQTSLKRTWQDQEKLPAALQFLPPTKTREPDPVLRQTHVETLLLLCTTHWGREYLRNHGVYEVVRALHEDEEVDRVRSMLTLLDWANADLTSWRLRFLNMSSGLLTSLSGTRARKQ